MQTSSKLAILADAAKYDASCASSGSYRKRAEGGLGNTEGMGICHSYTPDGRCVSLLKILMTNICIYDCAFCINRVTSNTARARFSVDEIVNLTVDFYKRNYIEGLFLSSGIIQNEDYTMEQLVSVAKKLRTEHGFGGYIHLKAIPGASAELLSAAGTYADRLSANIELPKQSDLDRFAPAKSHKKTESTMATIKNNISDASEKTIQSGKQKSYAKAGQTTQMIVGASESTDADLLLRSSHLYKTHKLRRIYYSAFSPIPDASAVLPTKSAPLIRENRLYQADWLFRFYGFSHDEFFTGQEQNLALDVDPKTSWALRNRKFFPVDINRASREWLLRVPGFGVQTVDRILKARKYCQLKATDLIRMRVPWKRAQYFVITADGFQQTKHIDSLGLETFVKAPSKQLSLF